MGWADVWVLCGQIIDGEIRRVSRVGQAHESRAEQGREEVETGVGAERRQRY